MTSTLDWLAEHDGSSELLCAHAKRLVAAGDLESASRAYQLAGLRQPFDPNPWIGLGLCQKGRGDPGAAELSLTVARALGADHPGLLAHRAECHLRLGRAERAVNDLEDAVREASALGDDSTELRALRALALINSSKSGGAS